MTFTLLFCHVGQCTISTFILFSDLVWRWGGGICRGTVPFRIRIRVRLADRCGVPHPLRFSRVQVLTLRLSLPLFQRTNRGHIAIALPVCQTNQASQNGIPYRPSVSSSAVSFVNSHQTRSLAFIP